MRALVPLLAACLALLAAAPAFALAPPPTVRNFDDLGAETPIDAVYADQGIHFSAEGDVGQSCGPSGGVFPDSTAPSQPNTLEVFCAQTMTARFDAGQAYVAMRVRPFGTFGFARREPVTVVLTAFDPLGTPLTATRVDGDNAGFIDISVSAPGGVASIGSVVLEFPNTGTDVDDVAYSDVAQPDTEITSGPPAVTNATTASFAFAGNMPGRLICQLDAQEPVDCDSPQPYRDLAAGAHTFTVYLQNTYGDNDPTPASYSWEVDRTGPVTVIGSGPPDPSPSTSARFEFSSPDEDVDHFDCALDDGPVEDCTSPKTYNGLAEGAHQFRVRAVDRVGNSRAMQSYGWDVDLTPPGTTLGTPLPNDPSNSTSATFRFASPSTDTVGFECRLDAAAFAACVSPKTYTDLSEGEHTFRVRAIDRATNRDGTPAEFPWVIDTGDPGTVIDDGPPALGNQTAATLRFSSTNTDVSRFQCSIDRAAFSTCVSPATFTVGEGAHTARVRAIDGAGNSDKTPAERAWQVDLTPPDTAIGELTLGASPALTFSSPSADVSHFECALDAGSFAGCASPHGLAAAALALGGHAVAVRAVDAATNADPTPATRGWTIAQPDGDGDGVVDAAPDNCVDAPNADQADRDKDGIGDVCDKLPPGDLPAQAGVRAAAQVVSGEVFVKLPGASTKAAQKGFVPLVGLATVPMGSLLDTRAGVAAITTAADFRRPSSARHRTQNARLAAGIFRIKQARKRRRAAPKRPFTDLALVSAAASENVCATANRTSPTKGIVRQVAATTKGRFRTFGGASTTTATKGAAFRTIDRCTGTETRVTRGSVRVLDRERGRTVTVTARKNYIAKARLFRTKKGRRH